MLVAAESKEKKDVFEIILKNVSKTYGESKKKALDDVSFSVRKGTIHGFIGSNGSGKSTTMSLIAGSIIQDEGLVTIEGRTRDKYSDENFNENLGFICSEPFFPEEVTVFEYAIQCGYFRDICREEVENLMSKSSIYPYRDVVCNNLSTGWKKLLQFFCVSLYKPKIFVLDEPFNGLDINYKEMVLNYLLSLKKYGGTIFLSTHSLHDIQEIADYITIIDSGKIVYDNVKKKSNVKEIFEKYSSKEVGKNEWLTV
jgi:ABC-2 type transport system ATP-binding protein